MYQQYNSPRDGAAGRIATNNVQKITFPKAIRPSIHAHFATLVWNLNSNDCVIICTSLCILIEKIAASFTCQMEVRETDRGRVIRWFACGFAVYRGLVVLTTFPFWSFEHGRTTKHTFITPSVPSHGPRPVTRASGWNTKFRPSNHASFISFAISTPCVPSHGPRSETCVDGRNTAFHPSNHATWPRAYWCRSYREKFVRKPK